MSKKDYKLLVMDQSIGPVVFDLIKSYVKNHGPAIVHTGSAFSGDVEGLKVIQASSYDNSTFFSRFLAWSKYLLDAHLFLKNYKGRAFLLLSSNPPLLPFLGYIYKRLKGYPYIVRILDVYPDIIFRKGLIKEHNPLIRAWSHANSLAYNNADTVITLGEVMAKRLRKYVDPKKKIEIIPDWVDAKGFVSIKKDENWFAKQNGQVGKLTLLFSGNLGVTHDISGLFKAAHSLQNEPRISFLMIGGGSRRKELLDNAKELSNMIVLPYQKREVLPYSMTCGDVAIAPLHEETNGISMPSRTYDMMAAGCAILALCKGDNDLKRIVEKYQCGLVVDYDDPKEICKAIMKFYNDWSFLNKCSENAIKAAKTVFSKEQCHKQYEKIFFEIKQNLEA